MRRRLPDGNDGGDGGMVGLYGGAGPRDLDDGVGRPRSWGATGRARPTRRWCSRSLAQLEQQLAGALVVEIAFGLID